MLSLDYKWVQRTLDFGPGAARDGPTFNLKSKIKGSSSYAYVSLEPELLS